MTDLFQEDPAPVRRTESPLQLGLLGAFFLRVQGQEVSGLSRPVKWLLALLVLHRSAPVAREWLAETLWPDAAQERSAFYLRRSLTELRAVLGPERARLTSPTRFTLQLDLTDAFCDAIAFDRLVAAEDEASLESAVLLYRGVFLEECGAGWAVCEQARRQESFLVVLETLAGHRERQGDVPGAVRLLRRMVEADPLRETVQRRVMKLLGQAGDYTGVERQYRELRRTLRDQLNLEPARETVTLYQQLRVRAQTEQTSADASAPRAVPFPSLPAALNSFVGRAEERAQAHAALQSARVVTLVGPGGVGKTRLALAVGHMEAANYPAGVCFADLSAAGAEADLLPALLGAFSLHSDRNVDLLPALLRFLQPRRCLLILDNAEQVAQSCARLAHVLLQNCPQLTILCTSRQPLFTAGEVVLTVSPLAIPPAQAIGEDAGVTMGDLVQCASVALLLDRVGTAAPGFRLDASNASAIAGICRCLEGLPLALELVAARFRSFSAQAIAHRLDLRFRLLSSGNPFLPRHSSLHAALDWSYDLLSEEERALFRRLSVFRGGWTLEAVEAMSARREDTLFLLSSLVDKSLVVYERQAGRERYRLLEMTRQYASERLEEQEQAEIEERHARYFMYLAEVYASPEGGKLPLPNEALLAEPDNFQAAHAWYLPRDSEAALWLESFLYEARVWPRGNWINRITQIEQTPLSLTPRGFQITCWVGHWALWNRHPASESLLLRLLEKARLSGNIEFERKALDLLSVLEHLHGHSDRSLEYVEAWFRLASPDMDACEISARRSQRALYMARSGQVDQALDLLKAQLEEERHREDWQSLCTTSFVLGQMLLEQKVYREALPYLEEAAGLASQWEHHYLTYLWRFQAEAAIGLADHGHAWHCLEQALRISRQNRQKDREAWTRWDMADLAFQESRQEETEAQMRACILAFKDNEEEHNIVECLLRLAKYCAAWGQPARAVTLVGSAKRGLEDLGVDRTDEEKRQFSELMEQTGIQLDQKTWQSAWKRGEQMTLDQAIEFVRTQDGILTFVEAVQRNV